MRHATSVSLGVLAAAVLLPVGLSAQRVDTSRRFPPGQGRIAERGRDYDRDRDNDRDRDRYNRDNDRDRDRYDDRYDRNDPRRDREEWWENRRDRDARWIDTRRGNGKGPAFCRSGAGHPVYGRQWCIAKGFGLGRDVRWDRVRWDDVVFRRYGYYDHRTLGRGDLIDLLGNVVYSRLDARRRYLGVSSPLVGRWHVDGGRSILLIHAGVLPLAELIDSNRDRRVELVLVNLGR
jgi:hypothetical protein